MLLVTEESSGGKEFAAKHPCFHGEITGRLGYRLQHRAFSHEVIHRPLLKRFEVLNQF